MIDTAALRKLLADTTKGRWDVDNLYDRLAAFVGHYPDVSDTTLANMPTGEYDQINANFYFIATAHTAMPALLDELDRLRAFVIANGWELENTGMYITSKNDETCRGCGAGRWLSTKAEQQIGKPIQYDVHEDEHAPGCIVAEARAAQKEAKE